MDKITALIMALTSAWIMSETRSYPALNRKCWRILLTGIVAVIACSAPRIISDGAYMKLALPVSVLLGIAWYKREIWRKQPPHSQSSQTPEELQRTARSILYRETGLK